ncbi:MAG: DUF3696 domain-containing protein [Ignavibacteria bacterium]|nr:DUF3696 domain-containing protein [Ignavibacteria bacterium]
MESTNFEQNEYYGLLNILSREYFNEYSNDIDEPPIHINETYDSLMEKFTYKIAIEPPPSDDVTSSSFEMIQNRQNRTFKDSYYYYINYYLKKLGFNQFYQIEIKDDVGRIYLIGKDNFKIYMSNSSSGYIQIFPIVAFAFIFKKIETKHINKDENYVKYIYREFVNEKEDLLNTLLIEQPELHLHPKLQSKLAELFSETIKNSDNNMFIETHSEHLIRKIQVLIANGELDMDKVSVMYFDNNEGSTKIKKMEIEENGFFKEPWPYGFFDDSANLSWELLTANKN